MTAQRKDSEQLPVDSEKLGMGQRATRRAFAAVEQMQNAWNRQFSSALNRSKK